MPLLDARFFVTAVLTQRESGGNLAEILDNLGDVIRQRFRVKRQIRVVTAHGRLTGWVLAMMPGGHRAGDGRGRAGSHPDARQRSARHPDGRRRAVGLWVLGYLIIRKLVDVEY